MKTWYLIKDNVKTDVSWIQPEKPNLAATKGIVYEAVFTPQPEITATQKLEQSWEIQDDKYVQVWTVIEKTPYEIAIEGWHHQDYAMRIKISMGEVMNNAQLQQFVSQLVLWWNLTKLQHEVDQQYAYFYCNFIFPEHQDIVTAFGELIEIENKPVE